jgi:predicted GH43/DUF377 family glycosyl hydrolase
MRPEQITSSLEYCHWVVKRLRPNCVYMCGAMRHKDQIVMPYAICDTFSNFATIEIAQLLNKLQG